MNSEAPETIAAAAPQILAALPVAAPGLSLRQIHATLGNVPFVARSLRPVLEQLEHNGRAASELGIGPRGRQTRFYRRVEPNP